MRYFENIATESVNRYTRIIETPCNSYDLYRMLAVTRNIISVR